MEDHNIFPFFDLPPELREMVYSYLYITVPATKFAYRSIERFSADLHCPTGQVWLISKGFTTEFGDYHKSGQTPCLVVKDETVSPSAIPFRDVLNPGIRAKAKYVDSHIVAECSTDVTNKLCTSLADCEIDWAVRWHRDFLAHSVLGPQSVQVLRVDLHLLSHSDDRDAWPLSRHDPRLDTALEEFIAMPNLARLRIYKETNVTAPKADPRNPLWVTWSKENGWEVPHAASQLFRARLQDLMERPFETLVW